MLTLQFHNSYNSPQTLTINSLQMLTLTINSLQMLTLTINSPQMLTLQTLTLQLQLLRCHYLNAQDKELFLSVKHRDTLKKCIYIFTRSADLASKKKKTCSYPFRTRKSPKAQYQSSKRRFSENIFRIE